MTTLLARVSGMVLLVVATIAAAVDAPKEAMRFRALSGAERWDSVAALESHGTMATGGMNGELDLLEDVVGGRSRSRYTLGPVNGTEGYDGELPWSLDPDGTLRRTDSAPDRQRARTRAWMTRRGYWNPASGDTFGRTKRRHVDGTDYDVVVATPVDADPVELWFGTDTGLLERTVVHEGRDTVVTRFGDWRDVDGLRLPFSIEYDSGDARTRVEITLDRIVTTAVDADAFAAVAPTAPTASIRSTDGMTRLPFDLLNNHIHAEVRVDGKPVRVLVDTGGLNILTPATAHRLGLDAQGKLAMGGVGEKRQDLALARAATLEVGAARIDDPLFYVLDLGALSDVEGADVEGIVGYEVFHRFGVVIDYANGVLVLSEPARFVAPAGATAIPFTLAERTPVIAATLDGLPATVTVDTGSRSTLTTHAPFTAKHDLKRRYAARDDAVVGWGVGGAVRGWPVRFGTMVIGGIAVRGFVGDLYTGTTGAFADPDFDANLGGGILRRFTVAFDYRAQKMYLAPNATFADAYVYDRSGLWLMRDGDALRVGAVAPNSPAQRAGVAIDRRIARIDGERVGARTLSAWRDYLRVRPAGERVVLAFADGGPDIALTLADLVSRRGRTPP